MRAPVALAVAGVLLRELGRALVFPLHVVAYWPRRRQWRQRTRAALAAAPAIAPARIDLALPSRDRPQGSRPHLFFSAGESSGEAHAAELVRALQRAGVDARCTGFGGAELAGQGVEVRFPLSEHAIMGVAGVLRSLPFLVRAVARFVRLLRDDPPDLAILVDYPGLHLVLGGLARRHGVPVLHYIAPQLWGWAPWRVRRYRRAVDASLTILPFEPHFYREAGVSSAYMGHPVLDRLAAQRPPPDAVAAVRARPTVCMLPGSRRSEIASNLAPMVALARRLRRDRPDLRFVVPHTSPRRAAMIAEALAEDGGDVLELREGRLAEWLEGARLVVAKSGTGSLEACLHGTPTVVVYRMRGPWAGFFHRHYLTVPWIAAANLIANRQVVPEHVFAADGGWSDVERSARALLADGEARARCLDGLAEVRQRLGEPGASDRTARFLAGWLEVSGER